MSKIIENDASIGSISRWLRRTMIAVAAVGLVALTVGWLTDQSTQGVLADTAADPTATPSATPLPETVAATPSPSPTAEPTRVAEDELTPSPTPSSATAPPPHVVRKGETLTVIARAYGISVEELAVVNQLANPDLVYVGQRLEVPTSAPLVSTPEPSPTPESAEPTPIPSLASPDELIKGRWIDVDISEQRLTAYEGDVPVRTTLVSTGLPNTPTPLGQFRIWVKFRYDDMAGADYYIEDVPYVMYFHQGYGLHGVTWHGNFGHPMSHGCVNLPTEEAGWLFEWADIETLVNIHE
ncbi:MAG: L,D-transpeptidase family protein [Anaerolineae bacterium]|nr:L,D-transpeptidase family protein [Anaerolineae bacterium]